VVDGGAMHDAMRSLHREFFPHKGMS
jgi:hypothetical protein